MPGKQIGNYIVPVNRSRKDSNKTRKINDQELIEELEEFEAYKKFRDLKKGKRGVTSR